ncbi:MAG: hypothetical protein V4644_01500 [Patescibacteria group bacterium]
MLGLHRLPIIYFFWKRHRTCWRKFKHHTLGRAEAEARRLRGGVHAYRCPYCRKWHVGHPGKR